MRSQNTEKVTHIKGRLLDQTVSLFNFVPFQNGNFSERKEFAPRRNEFFPLRAVPYGMENHFYQSRGSSLNATIFITHVHKCVMGAKPMDSLTRQQHIWNKFKTNAFLWVFFFYL